MRGHVPSLRARSFNLLQREGGDDEKPPMPAPAEQPAAPAADGGTAQPPAAVSPCDPKGLKRVDYLAAAGTSTGDFGLTVLDVTSVTYPEAVTSKGKGGHVFKSTTAALPVIPSIYTAADTFTEGEAHFISQGGPYDCPSGKLPIRWTILAAGANRIRAGEQEHCNDFQLAFDRSLKRYADAVNALAASGRKFPSQAAAERALKRQVGADPADWRTAFVCLARKTRLRDKGGLHDPALLKRPPQHKDGCAFSSVYVHKDSLPKVGTVPSGDIVKDCEEAGAKKKPAPQPAPGKGARSEASQPPASEAGELASEQGEERDDAQVFAQRSSLAAPAHASLDTVSAAIAGPGQSMDAATRGFMESRFSRDFSNVRVHTGATAAASAASLNATAYTVGRDIVFNHGAYAPDTLPGRHLLAHELAHVVQQREAGPMLQRELYYGGGYPQVPYKNAAAELKAASGTDPNKRWHPATLDMAATAAGSGGGQPVSTVDALLAAIEAASPGSISRLNLVGHSDHRAFSFGGTITAETVRFSESATLYTKSLADRAARIAKLKDRFASGAKIVLYSCNAGVGSGLLDQLSQAFGVCVEGFGTEVWWCISLDAKGQLIRGRTWAEIPNDPLPGQRPDCAQFASDVTTLTPGASSCVGAKAKEDTK